VKPTKQVQELSSEDESSRNRCQIARCNAGSCGGLTSTKRPYATGMILKADGSGAIREIEGTLCQLALGQDHCCLERYADNATFLRSATDDIHEDACDSCQDLKAIAGPVTLYIMRHAEGCHNMKARALRSHTHKIFGKRDAPLTDAGMTQAAGARTVFVGLSATPGFSAADWRVLVSPMRRAQQTMSIALHNTPFETIQAQVTPYANERSNHRYPGYRWINTPENTPTTPAVQKCLMDLDNPRLATAQHSWHKTARCPRYFMSGPTIGQVQVHTCTAHDEEYSSVSQKSSPQEFVDFIVARYGRGGRVANIILTGHSNWAQDAGLTTDKLDNETHKPVSDKKGNHKQRKINWASVYRVDLVPGNKVQHDMANAKLLYDGTARSEGSTGFIEDDARCKADVAWHNNCSGGAQEDVFHAWYWHTAGLAALYG